jgi:hypothetical protein
MRYETTTKLEPNAALESAERFFSGELGLTVQRRDQRAIELVGGGGLVTVSVIGERPTTLDIATREWDTQVTAFIGKLPR